MIFRDGGVIGPKPTSREQFIEFIRWLNENHPEPMERKFVRMPKGEKESRLNIMIPTELRQEISDIAFLTKNLSEKEFIIVALKTQIAKVKDTGGEKLAKALEAVSEAREV